MAWNLNSGDQRFKEVPEMTTAILKFSGDRVASFTTSFGAADRSVLEVIGTKGVVKMDPAYEMVDNLKCEVTIGGRTTTKVFKKSDQFAPELVYFSDCIRHNKQPEPSGREGLADVRIIQALLRSAETNRPVATPPTEIRRRPTSSQEISKQPVVKPPELVRATAPGKEN
jgi:predicted dehydrogenase